MDRGDLATPLGAATVTFVAVFVLVFVVEWVVLAREVTSVVPVAAVVGLAFALGAFFRTAG